MTLSKAELERIDLFFHPQSVAVVGASDTPGKFGYQIVKNLIDLGFPGSIHPINPRASKIQGLKSYHSVTDIPGDVHLTVIAVPSKIVPSIIKECESKGVKNVLIIASGFNEAGPEGRAYQREVLVVARRSGMRIVGPNTTGILNPEYGFTSTFVPMSSVKAGGVSFISQTGMFAGMLMEWIVSSQEFGFRKVAGLGNKCDVSDHEMLYYLAQDEGTEVILMHMEGTERGIDFFEALRHTTRIKPVVIVKAGRSEAGARAAGTHTASLAGNDLIFDFMLKQSGAVRVEGLEELVDVGKAFHYQPLPHGNGTSSVSLSGGAGVMAADALVKSGLSIKKLQRDTLTEIRERSPVWANPSSPLDLEPLSENVGYPKAYAMGLDALLSDKGVSSCMVIHGTMFRKEEQINFVFEAREKFPHKPLAVCILGDRDVYDELFRMYERKRVPVYPSVERAARALGALYYYSRNRGRK